MLPTWKLGTKMGEYKTTKDVTVAAAEVLDEDISSLGDCSCSSTMQDSVEIKDAMQVSGFDRNASNMMTRLEKVPTSSNAMANKAIGQRNKMEDNIANLSKGMSRASVKHGNTVGEGVTTTGPGPAEALPESVSVVGPPELDNASKMLKEFLLKNSSEFVRVNELREKGWFENKAKGDVFFQNQRANADHASQRDEKLFFDMMVQIGEEMHRVTGALAPPRGAREFKVLDICMAPGGYVAAVLKLAPKAEIYGITLSEKEPHKGHEVLLEHSQLLCVKKMDVTMLAKEFSATPIPKSHPDLKNFSFVQPYFWHKFNLVLCDGIKLRTQKREKWREENEATRLAVSQLILGLQRILPGGTLIMLMHKVDMWPSVSVLHTFSKFARVSVFKPSHKHQARSSFYMIAQDVRAESEAAKTAVDEWKQIWWKTTCGGDQGTGKKLEEPSEKFVQDVIEQFGDQLIELGCEAWRIQAVGLSRTEYAGDGSGSASAGGTGTSVHRPRDRNTPSKFEGSWRDRAGSVISGDGSPGP
ncbi:uncharacterized protein PAC_10700 [Phialocephala subalpina]|uniref:Ribosomal RNA methyltransferase FtsJ domain-containing protein n=1 Tax=Phialocephala subalpina TaxID=576137 RepID=A0A1L7X708_9HELO|nr:uncharacterized protein PAC_10700 [Phialocephala subalpina]